MSYKEQLIDKIIRYIVIGIEWFLVVFVVGVIVFFIIHQGG